MATIVREKCERWRSLMFHNRLHKMSFIGPTGPLLSQFLLLLLLLLLLLFYQLWNQTKTLKLLCPTYLTNVTLWFQITQHIETSLNCTITSSHISMFILVKNVFKFCWSVTITLYSSDTTIYYTFSKNRQTCMLSGPNFQGHHLNSNTVEKQTKRRVSYYRHLPSQY